MTTAIATVDKGERAVGRALIVADALTQETEQRRLLGQFVAHHMTDGVDYGVIPGTERKNPDGSPAPTPKVLLKPGAEKLTQLFRCVPQFTIEEKIENWDTGLFFYRFTCRILNQDEQVVAEGVGSATTYESRYRWRNADRTCPNCGKATIKRSKQPPRNDPEAPPGWYCFGKVGGCGANFAHDDESITRQATGRVQNPDLIDAANTVLKMAKKRAHVDAAITLARCSDIFTQDVEDMVGEATAPQVTQPQPQAEPITKEAFGALLKQKGKVWADALAAIDRKHRTAHVAAKAPFEAVDPAHVRGYASWLSGQPDAPRPQPASLPPAADPVPDAEYADPEAARDLAEERAAIAAEGERTPEEYAVDPERFLALVARKGLTWSGVVSMVNLKHNTAHPPRSAQWDDVPAALRRWAAAELLGRSDAVKKGA